MLIRFDFKDIFNLLDVKFDNYEDYKQCTKEEKDEIIKQMWLNVNNQKKEILSKIVNDNLIISNDYFWTISLNTVYSNYQKFISDNSINIKDLSWMDYEKFLSYKQYETDKVNALLDFKYDEIRPQQDMITKTLFNFVSSLILWYNINSINTYKIINIALYTEKQDSFMVYDFKGILTNIREYIIILYFILWWLEFKTQDLYKILLRTNNKKQNDYIKQFIKKKEINFEEFIKILWINKELVLSQELGSLIYELDLTNTSFSKDQNQIIEQLWIKDEKDLFKLLYLYFYFNFK